MIDFSLQKRHWDTDTTHGSSAHLQPKVAREQSVVKQISILLPV